MKYLIKNNFFAMGKLYKAGTTVEVDEVIAEKNKNNIVAIKEKVAEKRVKK